MEVALHQVKIQERYTEESNEGEDLSCGNTLGPINPEPGEQILDLGCGRGTDTFEVAKLVGETGMAYGLDLTPAMVELARQRAETFGIRNVQFVCGDIESLPYEEGSFDGVISNCVINHARDKRKVYEEIHRVLKTGGRFVIADPVSKEPLPESVKKDPEAWAQCFGGAVTEEEYLSGIRSAGFRTVHIRNRREYIKNGYDFISLTIEAVK